MAGARIFTPENRLASILASIEAPTAGELISDATARVDALADAVRAYVKDKLAEIAAYAEASEDVLFGRCRDLSEAALNVAEVAGAAGLGAVGEIARGINAMIDNLLSNGVWHTEALRLHLDALKLVSAGGGDMSPENEMVLARLRTMRQAVGVVE